MSNENVTNAEPEVEPEDANEEVTEFLPDEPHPDTPKSVLEEHGIEDRAYEGKKDDVEAEKTWKKLLERKTMRKTLVLPDPDEPGAFLTFLYRNITPGDSVLIDDVAIITGIVYNSKHEKPGDTLLKAVEEGRVEEFLQVVRNNRYQQSKTISLGLGRTIEDVEENITDPETRNALYNKIRGGAVPRLDTDELSDADTFHRKTQGQESEEATQTGGST